MTPSLRVIFMGTPDFAVPALTAVRQSGHNVIAVVTQPDRPRGRGRKLLPTPVKAAAETMKIPVIQPTSLKSEEVVTRLTDISPDVLVVVAFGHILTRRILDIPKLGAVNIHASLLPKFRGPAPIQWALINQEPVTGVTTMLLDESMDTGDILMTQETEIRPDDTAAVLHDRLAALGAELLPRTLSRLATGTLVPQPQDHSQASYAPLLKKADGRIDWYKPADVLEAFIRGMSPWPGAFTYLKDQRFKIYVARPLDMDHNASPGTVIKGFDEELRVATGKGALSILELQSASGKRLSIKNFLMGRKIAPGTVLA